MDVYYMSRAWRGKKRVSDALELELQEVVNRDVCAGK